MTINDADEPVPLTQNPIAEQKSGMATFLRSPGVKFIMIGIISVALLVPLLLVWGLTEERAQRATDVSNRIAKGWGSDQTINGPYIAVPFDVERTRSVDGRSVVDKVVEWALVMPETLDVTSDLKAEERKLSIYTLPVYNGALTLTGRFGRGILQDLAQFEGVPRLDRATLVLNINDIRGIRSEAGVKIDGGAVRPFEPGMGMITAMTTSPSNPYPSPLSSVGVHRAIEQPLIEKGFAFDIALSLNGSRSFAVAPAGQTTTFAAKANWPHPGFEGLFLPEEKTITPTAFEAKWTIPYLARGIDRVAAGPLLPLARCCRWPTA